MLRYLQNFFPACVISALLLLAGCDNAEEEIVVYKAPQNAPAKTHQAPPQPEGPNAAPSPLRPAEDPAPSPAPTPGAQGGMQVLPGMAEAAAQFGTPEWEAPAHWQPQPLGAMRKGSWLVPSAEGTGSPAAEISVIPGNFGTVDANVARWARPVANAPGAAETPAIQVGGQSGVLVRLIPDSGERALLGAIIPTAQTNWYFKLMGDRQAVLDEAENFRAFLDSVSLPQ